MERHDAKRVHVSATAMSGRSVELKIAPDEMMKNVRQKIRDLEDEFFHVIVRYTEDV